MVDAPVAEVAAVVLADWSSLEHAATASAEAAPRATTQASRRRCMNDERIARALDRSERTTHRSGAESGRAARRAAERQSTVATPIGQDTPVPPSPQ